MSYKYVIMPRQIVYTFHVIKIYNDSKKNQSS